MKPKDFYPPFSKEEKPRVVIQDRVWTVPDQSDALETFSFPGWEHPDVFGNKNPVYVEYCSGNGAWIADKALVCPRCNWVAIEKKFDRVSKIWSKIKNLQLKNVFVIWGEGLRVTANFFPSAMIEKVFINFPDPWPKRRHAKHRLITPPFVKNLSRILKKEGMFTVVTDDPGYSSDIMRIVQSGDDFVSLHPQPYYTTDNEGYGTSYFAQLWEEKGKTIRYHQFQKIAS